MAKADALYASIGFLTFMLTNSLSKLAEYPTGKLKFAAIYSHVTVMCVGLIKDAKNYLMVVSGKYLCGR